MKMIRQLARTDLHVVGWMSRNGVHLLRISLGIIFFWFGFLKFFPGLSPAQDLATRTIDLLTFGAIGPEVSIYILAAWETLIGIGLLVGRNLRLVLLLLFVQMAGTMTPIVLFPDQVFTRIPYAPTLEGQYIIKNLVLISAAIVIGGTIHGGWILGESATDGRAGEEGRPDRALSESRS